MRCLYCGKELALLKRWTSGGEFCSDAHRQQYQEEYNQLALNRLLQAKPQKPKPAAEPAPPPAAAAAPRVEPPAPAPAPQPAPTLEPAPVTAQAPIPEPEPEPEPQPEPELVKEPEPEPEPVLEEERAPADLNGFLIELPIPVGAEVRATAGAGEAYSRPFPPQLPRREIVNSESTLVLSGHLTLAPSGRARDYASRPVERRLEVREFVRAAPAAGFDAPFALNALGEAGLTEISEESMDILFFPHPPRSSPELWQQDAAAFAFGYELGALSRVAFRTTGLEDTSDGLDLMPVEPLEEQLAGGAPAQFAQAESAAPTAAPVPEPASKPAAAPVITVRVTQPLVARTAVFVPATPAPPAEPKVEAKAKSEAKAEPEVITRPLPLTLHGLAAGRGKPVQVFPSGVAGDVEIQAPRSNALPLRPVMTLGPAPAGVPTSAQAKLADRAVAVKTEVKPEPKKAAPQPARSDPRFTNGKTRKLEIEKPEPKASEPAKESAPEPKPSDPKPVDAKTAKVESTPPEPKPPEPKPIEPLARPYTPPDLGLPKLTIESSGMPAAARIGIAAAVLLVLGLIAYFGLRGGATTVVANSPQVVPGASLMAPDSGWIGDWGAEPGVRREHDISVLRPSIGLSDYRIEFQAQIENKALGWVFRAKDGKNYYVGKLEIVTPGLEPVVAAVHFAVIDGQAEPRSQTPLAMKVRLDTLYKVRFDALGDHFTTYVQDQKVDDWSDGRLKIGGVGLYNERGERMSLDGRVNVVSLVIKK